jgi:hypothetical protein
VTLTSYELSIGLLASSTYNSSRLDYSKKKLHNTSGTVDMLTTTRGCHAVLQKKMFPSQQSGETCQKLALQEFDMIIGESVPATIHASPADEQRKNKIV